MLYAIALQFSSHFPSTPTLSAHSVNLHQSVILTILRKFSRVFFPRLVVFGVLPPSPFSQPLPSTLFINHPPISTYTTPNHPVIVPTNKRNQQLRKPQHHVLISSENNQRYGFDPVYVYFELQVADFTRWDAQLHLRPGCILIILTTLSLYRTITQLPLQATARAQHYRRVAW